LQFANLSKEGRPMTTKLGIVTTLGVLLLGAGLIGRVTTSGHAASARDSAHHTFYPVLGDRVVVRSAQVSCKVEAGEVGKPTLFCQHSPAPHYQVVFYRDALFVWKIGNPDKPAFHARP
jgi:hypothetical protein